MGGLRSRTTGPRDVPAWSLSGGPRSAERAPGAVAAAGMPDERARRQARPLAFLA